jgi:hypothetical protein
MVQPADRRLATEQYVNDSARSGVATQQVAATVSASGALVVNKHNPVDASGGTKTMTLPNGQLEGTQVSVEKADTSANAVAVTGSVRGVAGQTISLVWANEALLLRADSNGSWWPIAGHKTKASLDAAYALRSGLAPVATSGAYSDLTGTPAPSASVETASLPRQLTPTGAVGAGTTASAWDHVHPRAFWAPADHGFLTWTIDPATAASSSIATSGTLHLARVHIPVPATVTNIVLHIVTQGSGLAAGQSFAALYTSAGALVATTADQSTSWASAGVKTMALTTPQAVTPGDYYIGFWSTGTTPPVFARGNNSSAVNAGLASSVARFAVADTGLTTTAPATMAVKVASGLAWFAALS